MNVFCQEEGHTVEIGGSSPLHLLNPFSHGVFFVSRLTAVGHMRHPFKADLGEK
jgi:hypothetical protein